MKKLIVLIIISLFLVSCNSNYLELETEIEVLKKQLDEKETQHKESKKYLEEKIILIEKENTNLIKEKRKFESTFIENDSIIDEMRNREVELEALMNRDSNLFDIALITADNQIMNYIISIKDDAIYTVNIVAFDDENYLMDDSFDQLSIDAPGEGEILKMQILGSIYDFQVIELEWDESANSLKEVQVLNEISNITNTTVYVDTYINCGIPNGKIKWKNVDGKEFEFYLSQDGYGFSGSIILCQ